MPLYTYHYKFSLRKKDKFYKHDIPLLKLITKKKKKKYFITEQKHWDDKDNQIK